MLKFASLTAMALALSVSGAMADGMSLKDAPPAFGWGGLYFGGTVGYGWGSSETYFNNCNDGEPCGYFPDGDHPKTSNDPSGALAGVTIGYNRQLNDKWVAGVEGDLSMADIKGKDNVYWGDGHRWHTGWGGLATLRARAGYLYTPQTLIYGTAGFASVQSSEYNIGDQVEEDDQGSDNTGWRMGYAVGLGVEHAFSERWSGKIEYMHVGLFDNEGHGIKNEGASTYGYENDLDVVRLGLNYKVH